MLNEHCVSTSCFRQALSGLAITVALASASSMLPHPARAGVVIVEGDSTRRQHRLDIERPEAPNDTNEHRAGGELCTCAARGNCATPRGHRPARTGRCGAVGDPIAQQIYLWASVVFAQPASDATGADTPEASNADRPDGWVSEISATHSQGGRAARTLDASSERGCNSTDAVPSAAVLTMVIAWRLRRPRRAACLKA